MRPGKGDRDGGRDVQVDKRWPYRSKITCASQRRLRGWGGGAKGNQEVGTGTEENPRYKSDVHDRYGGGKPSQRSGRGYAESYRVRVRGGWYEGSGRTTGGGHRRPYGNRASMNNSGLMQPMRRRESWRIR